jgi:hypothetical protein
VEWLREGGRGRHLDDDMVMLGDDSPPTSSMRRCGRCPPLAQGRRCQSECTSPRASLTEGSWEACTSCA